MEEVNHIPVLSKEVIDNLNLKLGDVVIDGTLGGAGHAQLIVGKIGKSGTLVGFDLDSSAIARASEKLRDQTKLHLVEDNFRNVKSACLKLDINKVDAALLDLGVSSYEIGASGRGFSFLYDEPLLMTFEQDPKPDQVTARVAVNNWSAESLETIFKGFGGEKYSWKIAQAIVRERETKPINTTFELVRIIESVVKRSGKLHPATKVFQALRIAVNDELGALKTAIADIVPMLGYGARFAIISFHEGEDRIVKHHFKELAANGQVKILTKKPIIPSDDELRTNPRSRSAKLRVIEKI